MDHPASLPAGQPWRAAALVAAGVAALELFLLVILGLAFIATPFADEAASPGPKRTAAVPAKQGSGRAEAPKPVPAAKLARNETSVMIFNGNGITGAAGNAANVARSMRYLIAGTADARRTDYPRSLVMYRPGFEGEAARLARDLRVKRIAPLDGLRPGELQGAQLALIVGRS